MSILKDYSPDEFEDKKESEEIHSSDENSAEEKKEDADIN